MFRKHLIRLHWRLLFPVILLIWLIIGISIAYFVSHEKQRQKENLENRLLNVNNTVVEAYELGADLQSTVNFIKLFTDKTTLDPLRITVYDNEGRLLADNNESTITLHDADGKLIPELKKLKDSPGYSTVCDMSFANSDCMVSLKTSPDGQIHSYAALPYEGQVLDFLSYDRMVWIAVIALGVLLSVLSYFGVRAICKNVYSLRDFARAIANDKLPDDVDSWQFSKDELGDVSRNLVALYRDKIHAEHEKTHHERQIGLNVSHELNTPVGIIKGYLDTVIEDESMPEAIKQKFLMRAQQNVNRLANLVNDVSMVMRLEINNNIIERVPINLYDFTSQLAEDITQGHIADSMSFDYDIPKDCMIMGHESLLTNAILNLVYNAAQYSEGSNITFRCEGEKDGKYTFTFADNGKGVDEEHIPRLFDLFYRVDSGRARKKGGSGLGLPLVYRVIVAMGGDIEVGNAAGGGLKFTFSLPKA